MHMFGVLHTLLCIRSTFNYILWSLYIQHTAVCQLKILYLQKVNFSGTLSLFQLDGTITSSVIFTESTQGVIDQSRAIVQSKNVQNSLFIPKFA